MWKGESSRISSPDHQGYGLKPAAEQGGLLLGDILIALDGTPLRYPDDLLACLSTERIGTTVLVRMVRGGEAQERSIVIGERP